MTFSGVVSSLPLSVSLYLSFLILSLIRRPTRILTHFLDFLVAYSIPSPPLPLPLPPACSLYYLCYSLPPGPSISVLIDSIRVSLTRALPSFPFLPPRLFIHRGFATALLDLFVQSFLGPPCMTLPTPPQ